MMTRIHLSIVCLLFYLQTAAQVSLVRPVTVSFQNPMTPLVILDHFTRSYPQATPFWSMTGKHYSVMFIDPVTALRHVILYDKYGQILRKETELDSSQCPQTIMSYCMRNFPNQLFDIWVYEDIRQGRKYYLKRRSREIWFDEDGNFSFKRRVFKGVL